MIAELLKIVLMLSIGQGIILALMLIVKPSGDKWANRLLATFILITVFPLWNEYAYRSAQLQDLVFQSHHIYWPMLYGPLLYLYTLRFTRGSLPLPSHWGLLALGPVVGLIMINSHFVWVESGLPQRWWHMFYAIVNGQIAICLWASWQRVKAFHQDIKQNLSNIEQARVDWITWVLVGYLVLVVLDFCQSSVKLLISAAYPPLHLAISIYEGLFLFTLGICGLLKTSIHFQQIDVKANAKYDNSTLRVDEARQLIKQLDLVMRQEQLFLDNELSLASLAQHLNVSSHHLSQALNEQLGQSFYHYINFARIEHAKVMLSDKNYRDLAIVDIAFQAGFNNKTSFNNAFKKFTQLTPSQFRTKYA